MPGNIVRTPTLGIGVCRGEYGGNLWFQLKIHSGVSYWNNGESFSKFRNHIGMFVDRYASEKLIAKFELDYLDDTPHRYWKQIIYSEEPPSNFVPW